MIFAPKAAQQPNKASRGPASRPEVNRPSPLWHQFAHTDTKQAGSLQKTDGTQAAIRVPERRAPLFDHESGQKNAAAPGGGRSFYRDFCKIPISTPERASQAQPRLSPLAAPFAGVIQTKLEVGAVDDPLEREADQVAEQVMRMPNALAVPPSTATGGGMIHGQRRAAGFKISRLASSPARSNVTAPSTVDAVLRSPGRPLDSATRAYFEPRFKHDFSSVRVHTDAQASESARQIDSLAYAAGTNVVFRSDTYAPDTLSGKGLLAHELAHVVQQGGVPAMGRSSERQPTASRESDAGRVIRRAPAPGTPPAPTPPALPAWIPASLRGSATHLDGDIWEVSIASLGRSPVGPHNQMQRYLAGFNRNRGHGVEPLESAHIIGGEHIKDLRWNISYDQAPTIGVAKSLHDRWTRKTANVQSKTGEGGGRATRNLGRAPVGPYDAMSMYNSIYEGIPELQEMSKEIIKVESRAIARGVMGADYRMPARGPAIDAHQGGMPAGQSGIDAHQGGTPAHESAIDAHKGGGTELIGAPLDPVVEAAHANQGGLAATEGAVMMLHEALFSRMQQHEIDKAERKLATLTPKIESLRAEGKDVAVTFIVEKQVPNITHEVISEVGDLVRFVDVRIDSNPWWVGSDSKLNLQAREESKSGTLDQQMKAQMGDRFPMDPTPPEGWHYESVTQILKSTKPETDGTYRAASVVEVLRGDPKFAAAFGLERTIFVHHTDTKALEIEMRFGSVKAPRLEPDGRPPGPSMGPAPSAAPHSGKADPSAFVPEVSLAPFAGGRSNSWNGVFTRGTPGAPDSYRVKSSGSLLQDKGKTVLLECVEGEDLDPKWNLDKQGKWAALIRWEKLW